MKQTNTQKIRKQYELQFQDYRDMELFEDMWDFYEQAFASELEGMEKRLIERIEAEKQTDEWVDFGENKLMRKQHQVGFNKAIDKAIELIKAELSAGEEGGIV